MTAPTGSGRRRDRPRAPCAMASTRAASSVSRDRASRAVAPPCAHRRACPRRWPRGSPRSRRANRVGGREQRRVLRCGAAHRRARARSRARARADRRASALSTSSASPCDDLVRLRSSRPVSTRSSRWIIVGAAAIAEERLDFGRPLADDLPRVVEVVGDEPAADLARRRRRGSPPRRRVRSRPSTAVTPAGSRLLPARSAAAAPASTVTAPRGSRCPAIQALRRCAGVACGANQVQRAPGVERAQADAARGRWR